MSTTRLVLIVTTTVLLFASNTLSRSRPSIASHSFKQYTLNDLLRSRKVIGDKEQQKFLWPSYALQNNSCQSYFTYRPKTTYTVCKLQILVYFMVICLFVYLSLCAQDNSKRCGWILIKFSE